MGTSLQLIQCGLLPEDQAREDRIARLHSIWTNELSDVRVRAQALREYSELVSQRPEYVVKKLERELGLSGTH